MALCVSFFVNCVHHVCGMCAELEQPRLDNIITKKIICDAVVREQA